MRTELYWIDGPWPGRLAIMPRPRGGDWLEDEVRAWKAAGVSVIVSALEREEADELDLRKEAELCRASGIEFITYPIVDRGVPASLPKTVELAHPLEKRLVAGESVAIHCRQGVGRASLLAASVLVLTGLDADQAFDRIRRARGCPVPETAEQKAWVIRLSRSLVPGQPLGRTTLS